MDNMGFPYSRPENSWKIHGKSTENPNVAPQKTRGKLKPTKRATLLLHVSVLVSSFLVGNGFIDDRILHFEEEVGEERVGGANDGEGAVDRWFHHFPI